MSCTSIFIYKSPHQEKNKHLSFNKSYQTQNILRMNFLPYKINIYLKKILNENSNGDKSGEPFKNLQLES